MSVKFSTGPTSYLNWMKSCHRAFRRGEMRMWVNHENPEIKDDIPTFGIMTLRIIKERP